MTNEDRLKDLLNIEEKNDIFNLTRKERREFQIWVKNLLEKEEPVSAEGEYIKKEDVLKELYRIKEGNSEGTIPINYGTMLDLMRFVRSLSAYSFPDRENDYMKAVRRDCGLHE